MKTGRLCLRRKINERIVIGDSTVQVLSIDGKTVLLGVVAPKDVRISRDEPGFTGPGPRSKAA